MAFKPIKIHILCSLQRSLRKALLTIKSFVESSVEKIYEREFTRKKRNIIKFA